MDATKLTEKIKEILEDKKAIDVDIIPVAEKTIIAETFIVASGTSTTHIKALSDEVAYIVKKEYGIAPGHIEGQSTGRWVLLDYKDVIVHIFHPEDRQEYDLVKLWTSRPKTDDVVVDQDI